MYLSLVSLWCGRVSFCAKRLLQGGKAVLDGKFNQTGQVGDVEFCHEAASVGFDGFGREVEDFGDFGAGFAFDDELENFAFARSEAR